MLLKNQVKKWGNGREKLHSMDTIEKLVKELAEDAASKLPFAR